MTQNNPELSLFQIDSVAIVGASETKGQIGSGLYESISMGNSYEVYCVNPKYDQLWGKTCYPSVLQLPRVPSHAVIAVGRQHVLPCLHECAEKGIKNVVVVTAGFKETDAQGAAMEQEMAEYCRQQEITLLGPNTLGFIDTSVPINTSFLPTEFAPGHVSVISQSGGVGMALLAALRDQHCGIAKWIGIGNEAVLDAVKLMEFLSEDPETKTIAVCFEGLRDLPGFLRLAAQVNRRKPVVLLQDGKGDTGKAAAASHTGTMAQSGNVMNGLIAQFGLLEARNCRECAAMLKALAIARPAPGRRATILTNTAGPSILAADAMEPMGVILPQPTGELQAAIDSETGIAMRLKNPADISSNGLQPRNYGIAAKNLLASDEYDILLGFFSLNRHLTLPEQELIQAAQTAKKPVVACFLSSFEEFGQYCRLPEQAGIPCYCDPQDAAVAVGALVQWGNAVRRTEGSCQTVMTQQQREDAERYLATLHFGSAGTLSEHEARRFLQLAGMEIDVPVVTASADEAVQAAARCGYPVALKIHSSRITHKSDVGGVRLNIRSEAQLREVYGQMLPAMRQLDPEALVSVQPMHPEGFELILGAARLPGLGALVMVGMGGIYSEVLQDTAFRMVPIGDQEPMNMLNSLRCRPILDGFRGQPLDKSGVASLIRRLGNLMEAFPQIQEIDMNPCRIYSGHTAVLDARIVIKGV